MKLRLFKTLLFTIGLYLLLSLSLSAISHGGFVECECKQIKKERKYKVIYCESTAYTHTGNQTSCGTWPNKGTVAVDPYVIKLGSKIWVEGYGHATALDTGSAIVGHKIDVFFHTEEECYRWGRRKVKVYVYED